MKRPSDGIIIMEGSDEAFFADHPDRQVRIRKPVSKHEFSSEFRTLGPHRYDRRRVLVARVNPVIAGMYGVRLMPIPFLAFADEEIADRDDILLPILDGIMWEVRATGGR